MKKMKKYLLGLMMVTMASQMMVAGVQASADPAASVSINHTAAATSVAATMNMRSTDTVSTAAATMTGTIQATVNLREKASTSSNVIRKLSKGEAVTIIGQPNSKWYQVKDSKGNTGYISSSSKYVSVSSSAVQTQTGTIQATVNLRAKASTSSSVIRKLSKGEQVSVLGQPSSKWYKVKDSKGNVGYISSSSKYVVVSGQASSGGSSSGSSSNGSSGSSSSGSSSSSSTASAKIEKVISVGMKYLGTPYEYGSDRNTTDTFDCSDFVRHVFIEGASLTLPADSRKQASYVKSNSTVKKSISSLKRGDLMFFGKYRGTSKSNYSSVNKDTETVTHVGIYLGDGKVLHTYSKDSGGVKVDTVTGKHWEYRFLYGGSVIK